MQHNEIKFIGDSCLHVYLWHLMLVILFTESADSHPLAMLVLNHSLSHPNTTSFGHWQFSMLWIVVNVISHLKTCQKFKIFIEKIYWVFYYDAIIVNAAKFYAKCRAIYLQIDLQFFFFAGMCPAYRTPFILTFDAS